LHAIARAWRDLRREFRVAYEFVGAPPVGISARAAIDARRIEHVAPTGRRGGGGSCQQAGTEQMPPGG
jgi:hypothetical protein